MDRIFCHFGPFFALLPPNNPKNQNDEKMKKSPGHIILHKCTINDKHVMYGSWDMECNGQNFFVILEPFLPFYPPNNPKNQNFKKVKENTCILDMCTKNDNHIMYGFWDMNHDRQKFLSFWAIFCTCTLLINQKIKILKKWKKCLEIL